MPGFSTDVLEDQTQVITTLVCCICGLLLKAAVQSTCGHRYCETCVKGKITASSDPNNPVRCPACSQDSEDGILNEKEIYPDFHARKQLKPLKCKCVNEGCSWRGTYAQYLEHEPQCSFTPIKCKEPGCGKPMRRSDLNYHLEKDCPMRKVKCRHCNEKHAYVNIKKHNAACPKVKVSCLNCGTKLLREHLEGHQNLNTGDCPNKKVPCPYNMVGCTAKVIEGEINDHLQSQAVYHAEVLVNEFTGLKNKVEKALGINNYKGSISQAPIGQTVTDTECETGAACASITPDVAVTGAKDGIVSETLMTYLVSRMKDLFVMKPDKMVNGISGKGMDVEKQVQTLTRKLAETESDLQQMKTLYAVLDKRNETFQEVVAVLNNQLEAMSSKIGQLERRNQHFQETVDQQDRQLLGHDQMLTVKNVALAEQDLRIQSLESAAYNGILVWKIIDFARRRSDAISGKTTSFYSPPFYTSYHGYKMCARIYLNGDGMGKGTHLSLFFVVMKGRYDNTLRWPFRQKVTFMLVDQSNKEHVVDAFRPDPSSSSFKKPTHEMNIASGCPLFVSLSLLDNGNYAYIRDDCLFVKVIVDVTDLERI